MGLIQGTSTAPAVSGAEWEEDWILTFTFTANSAALTAFYATIQRYAGSVSVATSTNPFSLPPAQTAIVHDVYVSGSPTTDALVDCQVNDIPQRLGVLLSAHNAQQAGRKIIKPFQIPFGAPFRFVAYNVAAIGTANTTDTVYASATILQSS